MFIDSASSSITRAPAERNFSIIGTWLPSYVSLRWSEEKFLRGRAFYKHLAPNGAKSNNVLLHLPDGSQRQSLAPAPIPIVTTAHVPKSRRPDYSVAPFGSG